MDEITLVKKENKTNDKYFSKYKVIKNILNPSIKEVRAHSLRDFYPWPGPSPYSPNLPFSVIHVPMEEVNHFLKTIVARYIKTLKKYSLEYFKKYNEAIKCDYLSDEEFSKIFCHSYYSRFITPLNMKDEKTFFEYIDDQKKYLKVDNSYFSEIEHIDTIYLESTVTLFEEVGKYQLTPIAILHNNKIITPNNQDWNFTKMLVLQASSNRVLISDHPKCHFPIDAFIGISHCLLSHESIIYKLLRPHFYMQLPLNFAVLYISKSVALNSQNEIYTSTAVTKEGFLKSFQMGFKGTKNSSTYPTPYQFRLKPQPIYGAYGDFLEAYWWTIYNFVDEIISSIEINYEDLRHWCENLGHTIPGFPSFEELQQDNNLTKVLTSFIHNVSIEHSSDHCSYSNQDILKIPLRLRKNLPHDSSKYYIKGEDYIRHKLSHEMFFRPHTLKKLIDVQYEFPKELQVYVHQFKANLFKTEQNINIENRFMDLNEISTSIQY